MTTPPLATKVIPICRLFKQHKKSGMKLMSREQPNQNKEMKIADSVLLSVFMRENERCNISHTPSTNLSGIQFSILITIGVIDPEEPEKYNNTEMKLGRLIMATTQHLKPAVFRPQLHVMTSIICVCIVFKFYGIFADY